MLIPLQMNLRMLGPRRGTAWIETPTYHPWLYRRKIPVECKEEQLKQAVEEEIKDVKKELKKAARKKSVLEEKKEEIPKDLILYLEMLRLEIIQLQMIDLCELKRQLQQEQDIVFVMAILAAD